MRLLAVDPGGVHVGWCEFSGTSDGTEWWSAGPGVGEWTPEQGIDEIAAGLLARTWDYLVVEEFRLYPDKAMAQTGSTMPTCELIGQIKWAHRLHQRHCQDVFEAPMQDPAVVAKYQNETQLILQPAAIQTPTKGVLRSRGIKSLAKRSGAGGHALSAELHGAHYIIRTLKQKLV